MASENRPDLPDDELGVPPQPGARRFTTRPMLLPEDDAGDGAAETEVGHPEPIYESLRAASVDEFFGATPVFEDADDADVDDDALDEVMPADPKGAVRTDAPMVWPMEEALEADVSASDRIGAEADAVEARASASATEPDPFGPRVLWFDAETTDASTEAGPSDTFETADRTESDEAADSGETPFESETVFEAEAADAEAPASEAQALGIGGAAETPDPRRSEADGGDAPFGEYGDEIAEAAFLETAEMVETDVEDDSDRLGAEYEAAEAEGSDASASDVEFSEGDATEGTFDVEEQSDATPPSEPDDADPSELDTLVFENVDESHDMTAPAEATVASPAEADTDELTTADLDADAADGVDAETAAVTAEVDEAFEAQADTDKADAPASGEIEGTLDVPLLGPEDFEADEMKRVLRLMLMARRLDEKMLMLLKQGKGFFHIGSSGHEASQIALGSALEGGRDWFCFYYRDLASALAVGFEPIDVLRGHYAKATDPSSGGRQMSEHYASTDLNILSPSSSVGAQYMPAVGFGLAIQRQGEPGPEGSAAVYASGGEGSTSQGAFHEALNWAAKEALPVLFHIQDNKYAISVPVEEQTAGGSIWHLLGGYAGLARVRYDGTDFFASASVARAAVAHARAGRGPVALHADVVRLLPHSSSDDHKKYREADALEADLARDPIPRFAARLVEAGVVTEEEVEAMRAEVRREVDALARQVEAEPDPDPASATKHVTYEGEDTRTYEADGETGDLVVMVDAINHALAEEMERDDRVLVYGEDVGGGKGGVFTATRGLTERYGRDRCFNSPLAEHSIIGSAVGLAAAGYKPVVEIQFADYIWPAMQPLRNQVAPLRYRSNGEWSCPMVVRVPCGGYIHGGLCHSQNVEALFAHFPGLQVVMPSNAADAKGLLKAAIRGEDPVLFLEHKSLYRQGPARSPEPHDEYLVPLGKARIAREGTDLTIVTWGALVYKALNVAKALEREGVSVEVVDVRSILPLDTATILASVRKTARVLIAHEDHEFMGFGAEIAAQLADTAFGHLDAPVKRVAGAFSWIPFADPLERAVLPQDDDVLEAARGVLSY